MIHYNCKGHPICGFVKGRWDELTPKLEAVTCRDCLATLRGELPPSKEPADPFNTGPVEDMP